MTNYVLYVIFYTIAKLHAQIMSAFIIIIIIIIGI